MLEADRFPDPGALFWTPGYEREEASENARLHSRSYRQLARVPRLPQRVAERLVDEFGSPKRLTEASEKNSAEWRMLAGHAHGQSARARDARRTPAWPTSRHDKTCSSGADAPAIQAASVLIFDAQL